MSSRPRTPEHFPRMKVRGGRRRAHAKLARQRKALAQISAAARTTGISFAGMSVILARLSRQPAPPAPDFGVYDRTNAAVMSNRGTLTPVRAEDIKHLGKSILKEHA